MHLAHQEHMSRVMNEGVKEDEFDEQLEDGTVQRFYVHLRRDPVVEQMLVEYMQQYQEVSVV